MDSRSDEDGEITQLLRRSAEGDESAFEQLIPLVYQDLKRLARKRRANGSSQLLETTALVHESYLKLVPRDGATWRDRAHFFAAAAQAIRHVIVDRIRRARAEKRGGSSVRVPLNEAVHGASGPTVDLLDLEDALERLSARDPRLGRVVECRFFAGMTMKETAEALGVSKRTAERDWSRARAYLFEQLSD